MDLTYSWKVTSFDKTNIDALSDVITSVKWECTGTDASGNSGTHTGTTPLDIGALEAAAFQPYDTLTADIVAKWVEDAVQAIPGYMYHINEQISNKIFATINPTVTISTNDFPWAATI